jgi:hypothetical protein
VVSAQSAMVLQYNDSQHWATNTNVNDVLSFGAGVTADAVSFSVKGVDLSVHYSSGDTVVLSDWFEDLFAPIQTLQFADGSSQSITALGATKSVTSVAAGGLSCGFGGQETIEADSGNDTLYGGVGRDTYEITVGAGATVIHTSANPTSSGSSNANIVQFDAASSDQLWFQQVGNDLQVSVIGTSTMVDISGWYASSANQAQEFTASDGKVLMSNEVNSLVSAMAAFSPPGAGVTTLPANYQTQLEPTIAAAWQ